MSDEGYEPPANTARALQVIYLRYSFDHAVQ